MNNAKITWIEPKCGGRIPPLQGARYTPIIKIYGMIDFWSADFICTKVQTNCMYVKMSFLSPKGPYHLLKPGVEFILLEGNRIVANGVIES
jgi:hypothetical protein